MLIENFFISGLSFETLLSEFKIKGPGKAAVNLDPEILFSMYDESSDCQKYTHFIFPQKVSAQVEKIMPMFHSFCSQDENGAQSFFHCFIAHEELTEYDLTEQKHTPQDLIKMREKKENILLQKKRQEERNELRRLRELEILKR